MKKIGFIGLGHMGFPMAINLINAKHSVTVYDINSDALSRIVSRGAVAAESLSQCAQSQDIIITMLQTGEQVAQVCLDDAGLFAHAAPNTLYIDCSSIDVPTSRRISQQALEAGLLVLDAPVSGGVAGAEAATLTFMVGGEQTTFEQGLPVLQTMGKNIIHTGQLGAGQAAKICNNMILGISMAAISEAYILAESLGLQANKLFEVASNASGQCWALTHYSPVPGLVDNVPANHDYKPGFTAAMMLKDLCLSQQAAKSNGVNTRLGAAATDLYRQFVAKGNAEIDFSAIIKLIGQQ